MADRIARRPHPHPTLVQTRYRAAQTSTTGPRISDETSTPTRVCDHARQVEKHPCMCRRPEFSAATAGLVERTAT